VNLAVPEVSLSGAKRDRIAPMVEETAPQIVSISDIHGYLSAARSALLTLSDHPEYDPVVTVDDDTIHWAGNDYVLVFNGDLVDRGPENDAVLQLAGRLLEEAPPGRVRITLGNHEGMLITPDALPFDGWYSANVPASVRESYLDWITNGAVVAAYEGYNVTYAHAGTPEPYDVTTVNDDLVEAAERLLEAQGIMEDRTVQSRLLEEYPLVLGSGDGHFKSPPAGLIWLDLRYMPADAPPQVVGHTRDDEPQTKGNVHCQNVIRDTIDSPGGECVFVESTSGLRALLRESDGGVATRQLE
jgi:hypothetical protein